MKINLRLFLFVFVLSAVLITVIFNLLTFSSVSAQATKQISAVEREDAYRANNLGAAYLEQYNHQAGAAAFRRALELNPQLTFARVNLAIALFNLQDLDAALRELQIAVEAAPQLAQPHYILG
ncbi:MAG: hypothetical protein M3Q78_10160, partial [Acidobacteriota bacterium]|nr:hypothetical protein [Acidobacteriota bacterium]